MIDLYYWTTPNGHKITIFLEEAGLHFPARCVLARFGGDPCMRFVSTEENLVLTLLSWVFVSARKIPFPGNGDGVRRDLVHSGINRQKGPASGVVSTIQRVLSADVLRSDFTNVRPR